MPWEPADKLGLVAVPGQSLGPVTMHRAILHRQRALVLEGWEDDGLWRYIDLLGYTLLDFQRRQQPLGDLLDGAVAQFSWSNGQDFLDDKVFRHSLDGDAHSSTIVADNRG